MRKTQPEFIFPEGATKNRGRFELAFSQIGSSVMIGGGVGSLVGLYNGLRVTSLLQQQGKLRQTQILNHVMKQGSATANSLGTLAVLYSVFGVLLQWTRGTDDNINTVVAGTTTGLLYKSTGGLRKTVVGGCLGLTISSLYVLFNLANKQPNFN
ncbi:TIMM23 family protein [Megaselia abdita]